MTIPMKEIPETRTLGNRPPENNNVENSNPEHRKVQVACQGRRLLEHFGDVIVKFVPNYFENGTFLWGQDRKVPKA